MADFLSSLPTRTENNGDVAVKVVDGTITSRQLTVNADGSVNITDNAGSLTVDANNLDIRDLVFATDKVDASGSIVALDAPTLAALESITVQNGAGASAVNIQDGGNSITVDGSVSISGTPTVDLSASSLAALESITVQNGAGASAVNIQDGGNSITVDGSVSLVSPGTSVADYNTAAAVAAAASSVHTYTAVGNFTLTQIEASGSGKMKIVVAVNGVNKFVQFNSTAETNMSIRLVNPLTIATTQTITITRTNLDKAAQDLYSTICGYT